MTKGTIVLAPFPFTDLSTNKRRPCIIVSSDKRLGDDVVIAFISSVLSNEVQDTDYVLKDSHPDFSMTGLKRTSVFKMDKLVTIEKRLIRGEIGRVSQTILNELDKKLQIVFDLE